MPSSFSIRFWMTRKAAYQPGTEAIALAVALTLVSTPGAFKRRATDTKFLGALRSEPTIRGTADLRIISSTLESSALSSNSCLDITAWSGIRRLAATAKAVPMPTALRRPWFCLAIDFSTVVSSPFPANKVSGLTNLIQLLSNDRLYLYQSLRHEHKTESDDKNVTDW